MNEAAFSPADEPQLSDRLVAYLDGELDAEECRQIEDLLASDPRARVELQRLEQAWNLLDELPRADVDASFTQTTVEMIALSAAADVAELLPTRPGRMPRNWLLGAVGVAAAAVAGFFATEALWTHPNEQLLENLSILENLDAYRQTRDIELLRTLKAEGIFAEPPEAREGINHDS